MKIHLTTDKRGRRIAYRILEGKKIRMKYSEALQLLSQNNGDVVVGESSGLKPGIYEYQDKSETKQPDDVQNDNLNEAHDTEYSVSIDGEHPVNQYNTQEKWPDLADIKVCPNCGKPLSQCPGDHHKRFECVSCGFYTTDEFILGWEAGVYKLHEYTHPCWFNLNPFVHSNQYEEWYLGNKCGATTYPHRFNLNQLRKIPNILGYYLTNSHQWKIFKPKTLNVQSTVADSS